MAFLWWNATARDVSPHPGNIGQLRFAIAGALKNNGYQNVKESELDVGALRDGVGVSIAHFPREGSRFWEVVMAFGDDDRAKRVNEEIQAILRDMRFL